MHDTNIDYLEDKAYTINFNKKLGEGAFGSVYEGRCNTTGVTVAIKIEYKEGKHNLLKQEYIILKKINLLSTKRNIKIKGFSKLFVYGETKDYEYLIIELLGECLEDLKDKYNRFSLKTINYLAIQMIENISILHAINYIHRDIKANNFLFDLNKKHLYLIDFGLAKKYMENNKHIPFKKNSSLVGTSRYISINIHNSIEASRRDDMISIGYLLIYLFKGILPWQQLNIKDKNERNKNIQMLKEDYNDTLCESLPSEFVDYFNLVNKLSFDSDVNYIALINIFKNSLKNKSMQTNGEVRYDW
jgi:serine/threonine protein kinase